MKVTSLMLRLTESCCGEVFEDDDDDCSLARDTTDWRKRVNPHVQVTQAGVLECLRSHLPSRASCLAVGSGTGQHVAYVAKALPKVEFTPAACTGFATPTFRWKGIRDVVRSVDAYCEDLPNVNTAVALDFDKLHGPFHAVLAIDFITLASRDARGDLFRGADSVLRKSRGLVFVSGPFDTRGHDLDDQTYLKALHHALQAHGHDGVLTVSAVDDLAKQSGFDRIATEPLANHISMLVYAKCAK